MIGLSYNNNSFITGMPKYQTESRSQKGSQSGSSNGSSAPTARDSFKALQTSVFSQSRSSSVSEIKRLGYSVANDNDVWGDTWEKVDQLPGAYELKDGKAVAWISMDDNKIEFRFFHAAESSEENPVLIARGVDENGNLFEQKIVLNEINPYNATSIEIHALTTCHRHKDPFITIPFADVDIYKRVGDRFDFISNLRSAIQASRMHGFYKDAAGYQEDIEFLLSVTKNQAAPDMYGSSAAKGAGAFGNDISGIQKAIERCLDAARERLASDMARKFSEKELSDTLWEK